MRGSTVCGCCCTIAHRRELCGPCTLDGEPAYLSGARNDFATVTDSRGGRYEWSWAAAERIMTTSKEFRR